MDYKNITYITKVKECPYCLKEINFSSSSKDSVRDSIKNLYHSMDTHFKVCEFRKLGDGKQLVKVSINTKKMSDKLYSSCFDTHSLLVG